MWRKSNVVIIDNTPQVLAVDIGGTFTDVVYYENGTLQRAKVHTTPENMHEGVKQAIVQVTKNSLHEVDYIFHGTTAVINALIERDGARTGLLTTEGFRDVYELGRGGRTEAFDMFFETPKSYIPRRRRLEVPGRIGGSGEEIEPLNEDAAFAATKKLLDQGTESIAICYINNYLNPEHEEQTASQIREAFEDVTVTISSDLVREWHEFERISTTVMNAYVKPFVNEYIDELEEILSSLSFDGELFFLQSNGGSMSTTVARDQPLALVESGPSAGIIGTAVLADHLNTDPVVSFDMGGTTAKASLIEDYQPTTTRPYLIGGERQFPSLLPSVDIKEIGAGGGSIAYLGEAGGLKVGPKSAGADPGPVCYGQGGTNPTVTDAHVVLGRINPHGFLGGTMNLDVDAAHAAIDKRIASPLDLSVTEAAQGILDIADDQMALLLREQTVERGHDPRNISLIASGGAGPLHVTTIARQLDVPSVVIPVMPANFSAFGMLLSDVRHEQIQTLDAPLHSTDASEIETSFESIESELQTVVEQSEVPAEQVETQRQFELCYEGQSHYVTIEVDGTITEMKLKQTSHNFHNRHQELYGFAAESEPIHVQNLRVVVRAILDKPSITDTFHQASSHTHDDPTTREIIFDGNPVETPIYTRTHLENAGTVTGPAIIEEPTSTTLLQKGDSAQLDEINCIRIEVNTND